MMSTVCRIWRGCWCFLLILFVHAMAEKKLDWPWSPTVDTIYGKVQGKIVDDIAVFYNVPFASPPDGDNRFKPPQPLEKNWSGTKDCSGVPKLCPQLKLGPVHLGSEDCLYLHIYVPHGALKSNSKLPVLFWIFGGGYSMGDAFEFGWYDGVNLAKNTNSVVVATNYRTGPLGFLAHRYLQQEDPEASTGNMGVRDQRAALEFVQGNIEFFGGDKKRVTIFGESAGAFSVCWHLASSRSVGLFAAAISESGSCDTNQFFRPVQTEVKFGNLYASKFGCDEATMAQEEFLLCLRKAPLGDVMNGLLSWFSPKWPGAETNRYFEGAGVSKTFIQSIIPPLSPVMPWGPVIDGSEVGTFEMPLKSLIDGRGSSVPAIFGSNKDEGTMFVPFLPLIDKSVKSLFPLTDAGVRSALMTFLRHNETFVNQTMELYPAGAYNNDNLERVAQILRDCTFACPARRAVRALSNRGIKSWLYHFVFPLKNWMEYKLLGNYHTSEMCFVWGNEWPVLLHDFNEDERKMSNAFQYYWGNLAASGDVNIGKSGENSFLEWPAYNASNDINMNMDWPLNTETKLYGSYCDFWDTESDVPNVPPISSGVNA